MRFFGCTSIEMNDSTEGYQNDWHALPLCLADFVVSKI